MHRSIFVVVNPSREETFNLSILCEEEKRVELVNDLNKSKLVNLSEKSFTKDLHKMRN